VQAYPGSTERISHPAKREKKNRRKRERIGGWIWGRGGGGYRALSWVRLGTASNRFPQRGGGVPAKKGRPRWAVLNMGARGHKVWEREKSGTGSVGSETDQKDLHGSLAGVLVGERRWPRRRKGRHKTQITMGDGTSSGGRRKKDWTSQARFLWGKKVIGDPRSITPFLKRGQVCSNEGEGGDLCVASGTKVESSKRGRQPNTS